MRKVITYLFLLFTFSSYSQNLDSVEYHLSNFINKYRLANGLNELKKDTNLYKASNKHSNYLLLERITTKKLVDSLHSEKNKDNIYYSGENAYTRCGCGENVQETIIQKNSESEIAYVIFINWKNHLHTIS